MKDTAKTGRRKDLETMAVLAIFFLTVYLLSKNAVFIIAAFILAAISVLFKKITSRIAASWLAFSRVLAGINSKIILTLLFYFILTPLALLHRLFNRYHLKLKRGGPVTTYFDSRDHAFNKDDFEKVW